MLKNHEASLQSLLCRKEDSFSIADQDKALFKNIALKHKIHVKLYVERMGTSLENYIYKMKEGVCYLAY